MNYKFKSFPPITALMNGIDFEEVIILNGLKNEKDYQEIAKDLEINLNKKVDGGYISEKIKEMKEKAIFNTITPNVDPTKIWNHYYFVFLKIGLVPPLMGPDIEYPQNWSDASNILTNRIKEDDNLRKYIRQMYSLQGIEWDFLLMVTINDRTEFRALIQTFTNLGFISKSWSFETISGVEGYFDPIGIPSIDEFKEGTEFLRAKKESK